MNEKHVLINSFEREIGKPIICMSLKEAQKLMYDDLISAINPADIDNPFDELIKDEDYGWEPDGDACWYNHRHGNSDWVIFKLSDILKNVYVDGEPAEPAIDLRPAMVGCLQHNDFTNMLLDIAQEATRLYAEYKNAAGDSDYVDFSNHLCNFAEASMNYMDAMIKDIREYYKEYLHHNNHEVRPNPIRKDENNA